MTADRVKESVSTKDAAEQEVREVLERLVAVVIKHRDAWNRFVDSGAGWPLGAVFVASVATDPSVLLGIGTWTALADGDIDVSGTPVTVWVWQRTA